MSGAAARQSITKPEEDRMLSENLFVWGDSIARGVMYDEIKERYTVCRETFDHALKTLGVNVRNYAKPGCTSKAALEILERSTAVDGAVAAIEFGGNDSDLIWKDVAETPDIFHEAVVTIADFKASMGRMIEKTRALGMHPIVVTPLPVVAERYLKWISRGLDGSAILKYLGSAQYIYRWQERYAYAAMEAARDAGCPVFDLRSIFLRQRDFDSLMSLDGIHPNPAGYQLITDTVLNAWQQSPAAN